MFTSIVHPQYEIGTGITSLMIKAIANRDKKVLMFVGLASHGYIAEYLAEVGIKVFVLNSRLSADRGRVIKDFIASDAGVLIASPYMATGWRCNASTIVFAHCRKLPTNYFPQLVCRVPALPSGPEVLIHFIDCELPFANMDHVPMKIMQYKDFIDMYFPKTSPSVGTISLRDYQIQAIERIKRVGKTTRIVPGNQFGKTTEPAQGFNQHGQDDYLYLDADDSMINQRYDDAAFASKSQESVNKDLQTVIGTTSSLRARRHAFEASADDPKTCKNIWCKRMATHPVHLVDSADLSKSKRQFHAPAKVHYKYYWNEAKDTSGRHLGFFGFEEGQPLSVAYEGDLATSGQTISTMLDRLFMKFNTEEIYDYHGPSMSVGSVITLETDYFFYAFSVESTGFKRVYISKSPIVNCNPLWHAISESDAWFKLERVYEYLSETHDTKDAADCIENVMINLFDEMSGDEIKKIEKIYPHMRMENNMRDSSEDFMRGE